MTRCRRDAAKNDQKCQGVKKLFNNIFDIINIPLGYVIKFCYILVPNYAIALLLFAILMKVVLFPLGIKQQKNMVKQASLRPREMAIRKRYAGRDDKVTQQKMNEEIMKFYQEENFNPAGGCLPLLIELPIILSLYNIITNPLKYICNLSADVINNLMDKAKVVMNLTEKDALTQIHLIGYIKNDYSSYSDILPESFKVSEFPDFSLFNGFLDLSEIPSFKDFSWLLIIPVITFAAVFISMKITRKMSYQPDQSGDAAKSMKIMDYTMPLFSVWISFTVPAVIGLYWIYQNILTCARQFVLSKMYPIPRYTDEDYKNAEREMNGKVSKNSKQSSGSSGNGEKKKVRSLHHIDDEEYIKAHEDDNDNGNNENNENTQQPVKNDSNADGSKQALIGKAELKDDKKDKKD